MLVHVKKKFKIKFSYFCTRFYELTVNGCAECACDPKGRVTQVCNKTTGLCTCKEQVMGMNCDQCKEGKKS